MKETQETYQSMQCLSLIWMPNQLQKNEQALIGEIGSLTGYPIIIRNCSFLGIKKDSVVTLGGKSLYFKYTEIWMK